VNTDNRIKFDKFEIDCEGYPKLSMEMLGWHFLPYVDFFPESLVNKINDYAAAKKARLYTTKDQKLEFERDVSITSNDAASRHVEVMALILATTVSSAVCALRANVVLWSPNDLVTLLIVDAHALESLGIDAESTWKEFYSDMRGCMFDKKFPEATDYRKAYLKCVNYEILSRDNEGNYKV
jgi:hypothetical protein